MIKLLNGVGISSDLAYGAAALSILGSIGIWAFYKSDDKAHAERFGIFVGLWAPTFAILARALEETERNS